MKLIYVDTALSIQKGYTYPSSETDTKAAKQIASPSPPYSTRTAQVKPALQCQGALPISDPTLTLKLDQHTKRL